jgi:hypothetical protein
MNSRHRSLVIAFPLLIVVLSGQIQANEVPWYEKPGPSVVTESEDSDFVKPLPRPKVPQQSTPARQPDRTATPHQEQERKIIPPRSIAPSIIEDAPTPPHPAIQPGTAPGVMSSPDLEPVPAPAGSPWYEKPGPGVVTGAQEKPWYDQPVRGPGHEMPVSGGLQDRDLKPDSFEPADLVRPGLGGVPEIGKGGVGIPQKSGIGDMLPDGPIAKPVRRGVGDMDPGGGFGARSGRFGYDTLSDLLSGRGLPGFTGGTEPLFDDPRGHDMWADETAKTLRGAGATLFLVGTATTATVKGAPVGIILMKAGGICMATGEIISFGESAYDWLTESWEKEALEHANNKENKQPEEEYNPDEKIVVGLFGIYRVDMKTGDSQVLCEDELCGYYTFELIEFEDDEGSLIMGCVDPEDEECSQVDENEESMPRDPRVDDSQDSYELKDPSVLDPDGDRDPRRDDSQDLQELKHPSVLEPRDPRLDRINGYGSGDGVLKDPSVLDPDGNRDPRLDRFNGGQFGSPTQPPPETILEGINPETFEKRLQPQ